MSVLWSGLFFVVYVASATYSLWQAWHTGAFEWFVSGVGMVLAVLLRAAVFCDE